MNIFCKLTLSLITFLQNLRFCPGFNPYCWLGYTLVYITQLSHFGAKSAHHLILCWFPCPLDACFYKSDFNPSHPSIYPSRSCVPSCHCLPMKTSSLNVRIYGHLRLKMLSQLQNLNQQDKDLLSSKDLPHTIMLLNWQKTKALFVAVSTHSRLTPIWRKRTTSQTIGAKSSYHNLRRCLQALADWQTSSSWQHLDGYK